ncbi:hypothetical protein H9P43_009428 [Blastocladiella emersonii ATCC 22665]|nr:hypothetical protein H9P43_009428 [Blastocladiella emersonii ATCC 22665]
MKLNEDHSMHQSQPTLALSIVEDILIRVFLDDPSLTRVDPLPLLAVAPGLNRLRRLVLRLAIHPNFRAYALKPENELLRDRLIQCRGPGDDLGRGFEDPVRSKFYAHLLCASGYTDLLDEWLNSNPRYYDAAELVDEASAHGQCDVLEWLESNELFKGYSTRALDEVICRGHWHTAAIQQDKFGIIDWLERVSGLSVGEPEDLAHMALKAGSFDMLMTMCESKVWRSWLSNIDWEDLIMDLLAAENTKSLDWIMSEADAFGADLTTNYFGKPLWPKPIALASRHNKINSLTWLSQSLYGHQFICPATWADVNSGDDEDQVLARLDWWRLRSGVTLPVDTGAIDKAAELGFRKVVAWWKASVLAPGYFAGQE